MHTQNLAIANDNDFDSLSAFLQFSILMIFLQLCCVLISRFDPAACAGKVSNRRDGWLSFGALRCSNGETRASARSCSSRRGWGASVDGLSVSSRNAGSAARSSQDIRIARVLKPVSGAVDDVDCNSFANVDKTAKIFVGHTGLGDIFSFWLCEMANPFRRRGGRKIGGQRAWHLSKMQR